jgi:hypothetical protein
MPARPSNSFHTTMIAPEAAPVASRVGVAEGRARRGAPHDVAARAICEGSQRQGWRRRRRRGRGGRRRACGGEAATSHRAKAAGGSFRGLAPPAAGTPSGQKVQQRRPTFSKDGEVARAGAEREEARAAGATAEARARAVLVVGGRRRRGRRGQCGMHAQKLGQRSLAPGRFVAHVEPLQGGARAKRDLDAVGHQVVVREYVSVLFAPSPRPNVLHEQ